jgi:hypothetical protein
MEFRKWLEQGTEASATGANAAGRAGESPSSVASPQGNVDNVQSNPNGKTPPSAFNVSSKLATNSKRYQNASPMAPGVKPLPVAPPSSFSPRGLKADRPAQFNNAQNNSNATVKIPSTNANLG